jgi:hypothetical protein
LVADDTGGTIWRIVYVGKGDSAGERPDSAGSALRDDTDIPVLNAAAIVTRQRLESIGLAWPPRGVHSVARFGQPLTKS